MCVNNILLYVSPIICFFYKLSSSRKHLPGPARVFFSQDRILIFGASKVCWCLPFTGIPEILECGVFCFAQSSSPPSGHLFLSSVVSVRTTVSAPLGIHDEVCRRVGSATRLVSAPLGIGSIPGTLTSSPNCQHGTVYYCIYSFGDSRLSLLGSTVTCVCSIGDSLDSWDSLKFTVSTQAPVACQHVCAVSVPLGIHDGVCLGLLVSAPLWIRSIPGTLTSSQISQVCHLYLRKLQPPVSMSAAVSTPLGIHDGVYSGLLASTPLGIQSIPGTLSSSLSPRKRQPPVNTSACRVCSFGDSRRCFLRSARVYSIGDSLDSWDSLKFTVSTQAPAAR